MIQSDFRSVPQHYSAYSAKTSHTDPSSPMMAKLAELSHTQRWILFTAQCPRPEYEQLAAHYIHCNKVIHMKPSQTLSELEIVTKAIMSGNASAVIASNQIDYVSQSLLRALARSHRCEVFFVEGRVNKYH